MSGPATLCEVASESKMLAISTPPPLPHLLSHHVPISSSSMLPPQNVGPLDPLSAPKKPKLSLKTSDLAVSFPGSVSRQSTVNTNATATPTTLNTFNNTFDLTHRPSPVSTLSSPGVHPRPSTQTSSPIVRTSDQPYRLNLPFGINPILKNSPLSPGIRRPSISASPRIASRRVFFPAAKKVTFRAQLEEEIVTQQYVLQHADLTSSEDDSTPDDAAEQSSTSNNEEEDDGKEPQIRVDEVSVRGRRKRKSVAVSPCQPSRVERGREDGPRSTSVKRSKRKRRWQWTIESNGSKQSTAGDELEPKVETSSTHDGRDISTEGGPTTDEAEIPS